MKPKESIFLTLLVIFIILTIIAFAFLYKSIIAFDVSSKKDQVYQPVSSENIILYEPRIKQQVGRVFQVKGSARVFENVVSVRIKNPITGVIHLQDTTIAHAPDVGRFGNFTYTVDLSESKMLKSNEQIVLEVYQSSAKDGSEIDTVLIPLVFLPY